MKSEAAQSCLCTSDDTTLMEESEEELKRLLMKVKVEGEKVGLKLNTQKTAFKYYRSTEQSHPKNYILNIFKWSCFVLENKRKEQPISISGFTFTFWGWVGELHLQLAGCS